MTKRTLKFSTAFFIAAFTLSLTGNTFAATASDAAKANNTLGLNLLKTSGQKTAKGNQFVSPVSLYLALSMLYNGAEKETATEIEKVLAVSGTRQEINAGNLALLNELTSKRDLVLRIANSLWARDGFKLKKDFLETRYKKKQNPTIECLN